MKTLLLLSLSVVVLTTVTAQLVPNGNSGSAMTSYTSGAPNDPIYIWCSEQLAAVQASLTATPTNGSGPFSFNWYYHNQATSSWTPYTTQTGATSTVSGLPNDGYRVEIRDAGNNIVDCYTAWVWNLNTEVTASNTRSGCNQANLYGTVNTTGSFTYYNPPPPESIINASTQIQVCFTATHTYVSDLAFYLVGPTSCGSPTILLSPNPGAIGQGSVCNSGDNVNNLCFTTTAASNLNVCASTPSSLSGTYSTYGPSSTAINWSPLVGCNAASGGWGVQIYDCISMDVGSLTNAVITFSNLTSVCGSPTTITYNSGTINSAINDNSCSAATASIFQVPPATNLTTPITITAATSLEWTSNPAVVIANSGALSATATGVPAESTALILTATTTFGGSSCSSDDTTFFSYSLPVVNAGVDQAVCTGVTVQLSGSGANSYSWDNGVTNGVAFVPAGTQTYTVTGTDANGCQNTDQVVVTMNAPPTVNAGPDQSVCPGASVTLSGSGAQSYTWNNGVTNGTAFTPAATTTYTVTGTDAAGCTGTDQVTVTIDPSLNPPVNAGADQSVCPGAQVTLSGSGAATYVWNNGVTNGQAFTVNGTQTYTVTGTAANGCQNTDQVMVTVYSLPGVNAGNDQSVCPGASVTLSGSGATTYTWNNGVTNSQAFVPSASQTYTVTGTDANGCQNTDQVTVSLYTLPNVNAGADQAVCDGASVTLSGSGAVSYSWNCGVTNAQAFVPVNTQTYTMTGTDTHGCQNTDAVTVTVNPLPNVNAGADQTVCAGTAVTLSGSGATTYSWSDGVSNNMAFIPGEGETVYTMVGTDANGCQNTDQVTITVVPQPEAGIATTSALTGYPGMSVTFENNSQFANAFVWNFDDGTTLSTTSLGEPGTHVFSAPGTYEVMLSASNGLCSDMAELTVIVLPYEPLVIRIPNVFTPDGDGTNDGFFIEVENGVSMEVTILNRWGNTMAEIHDFNEIWDGKEHGEEAAEGVYFFKYAITGKDGTTQTGQGFVELIRK